jgi:hypothetical protein
MSARFKFFNIYLIISFITAFAALIWIFLIWYPTPLAHAVGVMPIILIMLTVHIILGPALILMVYKENKVTLKLDLALISFIQFIALGYGIYIIGQGRPVWIVYNVDRFELIRNNELVYANEHKILEAYLHPSWLRPQYAAVNISKNTKSYQSDIIVEIFEGISLAQRPNHYIPLNDVKIQIQKRMQSVELLERYNDKDKVRKFLAKYPKAKYWVPLKGTKEDMVVLIDEKNSQVIKIVNLRPWL